MFAGSHSPEWFIDISGQAWALSAMALKPAAPAANTVPGTPSSLAQYQSNGVTAIAAGGTTSEDAVVLKATVSDPDGDAVRLAVEVKPSGVAFAGQATHWGVPAVSGSEASVNVRGLSDTGYHWQVLAVDSYGAASACCVAFGGPTDFSVSATREAVAVDSVTSGTVASLGSLTISHTIGSGSRRLLVVGVAIRDLSSITRVTYSGRPLRFLLRRIEPGTLRRSVEIWYLANPPPGTSDAVIEFSHASTDAAAGVIGFFQASQEEPLDGSASASGSGTTISVTLTTRQADTLLADVVATGNATLTVDLSQTERWKATGGSAMSLVQGGGSTKLSGAAGSKAMTWTLGSTFDWAHGALAVKPAYVNGPLSLAMEGLTATAGRRSVRISWHSESPEVLSFQTRRRTDAGVPYEPLGEPIAAMGTGPEYLVEDRGVRTGRCYEYEMEALLIDGSTRREGPVTACMERRATGCRLLSTRTIGFPVGSSVLFAALWLLVRRRLLPANAE